MATEIQTRIENALIAEKSFSGAARKVTQLRLNVWHPQEFDTIDAAIQGGSNVIAYFEGLPINGRTISSSRNLLTGQFKAVEGFTEEQIKAAYFSEIKRVNEVMTKK